MSAKHDDPFHLPDPDDRREVESRLPVPDKGEIHARFILWKDRLVIEFSIEQMVLLGGQWFQVARIDTCKHGTVHRHQLYSDRPDDNTGTRRRIEIIPPGADGWVFVDNWYSRAIDRLAAEWDASRRRWERGQPKK